MTRNAQVDALLKNLGYEPHWIPADTIAYWLGRSANPEAVIKAIGLDRITPICRTCQERQQ